MSTRKLVVRKIAIIILNRNSMKFYSIFHLYSFIVYIFVLTRKGKGRKILQKENPEKENPTETCKVVLASQVKSCKHKNLLVDSLTSENNTLKILHFKTIWFLSYLNISFVYKQKIH